MGVDEAVAEDLSASSRGPDMVRSDVTSSARLPTKHQAPLRLFRHAGGTPQEEAEALAEAEAMGAEERASGQLVK